MSNTKEKIEKIRNITGLEINSYKIINKGAESIIIEINEKWIFRFPRNLKLRKNTKERLNFLISFSKVSPIKIPEPKYIENDFIGYEKIYGKPLYPSNIYKLNNKDKNKIAKQLGLFLKTLHNYKNDYINFDTGYLVMRKKDFITCPKEIAKHLNAKEKKILETKFKVIKNNPLSFKKSTTVIHGDFHFNNILWDPQTKNITGVIDWSELGLGIPAMDFIMLANFNISKNDKFLKEILKYYGSDNDDLFFQIKENAITDVLNWYWTYYIEKNSKGMDRIIKKLKRILAQ